MDILIPNWDGFSHWYIPGRFQCNIEKHPGIFQVFCGFLSSSHSWMKDPPWVFENRGMFHLLCQFTGGYSQFLEASRKLQSWLNTPRNSDVLAYARAAAAAVPSSTGAPSLAFGGEIVMVKSWCNWGSHGFHTDWFQLGVTWSLAKLPRAFESWVLVSVLLQETIRPVWVRTASFSVAVFFNMW